MGLRKFFLVFGSNMPSSSVADEFVDQEGSFPIMQEPGESHCGSKRATANFTRSIYADQELLGNDKEYEHPWAEFVESKEWESPPRLNRGSPLRLLRKSRWAKLLNHSAEPSDARRKHQKKSPRGNSIRLNLFSRKSNSCKKFSKELEATPNDLQEHPVESHTRHPSPVSTESTDSEEYVNPEDLCNRFQLAEEYSGSKAPEGRGLSANASPQTPINLPEGEFQTDGHMEADHIQIDAPGEIEIVFQTSHEEHQQLPQSDEPIFSTDIFFTAEDDLKVEKSISMAKHSRKPPVVEVSGHVRNVSDFSEVSVLSSVSSNNLSITPLEYSLETGFKSKVAQMIAASEDIVRTIERQEVRNKQREGENSSLQSQSKCVVLLLDPRKKIFELVYVPYIPEKTTVGDILDQLPVVATDRRLARLSYTGLIHEGIHVCSTMIPIDIILDAPSTGKPLFAVPARCTWHQIEVLGNSLLHMPQVARLLDDQLVKLPVGDTILSQRDSFDIFDDQSTGTLARLLRGITCEV